MDEVLAAINQLTLVVPDKPQKVELYIMNGTYDCIEIAVRPCVKQIISQVKKKYVLASITANLRIVMKIIIGIST